MTRLLIGLLCGVLLSASVAGAGEAGPTEYQVKAAFLYHFVKFIDWPDSSSLLKVCVIGEDPFGMDTDAIEGKTAAGKVLSVARIRSVHEMKKCQMVFISSSENERLESILTAAQGLNLLTVGDAAGYAGRGVIINFYKDQGKVRFEINRDAAGRSGLKISAKLFSISRIVHDARKRSD